MSFDLKHLRAFVTIVEEGSIGRAAMRLNTSQPALSRLIRSLEHDLQDRLFERRPTGMELTAAGEVLHNSARLLVAEADKVREDLFAQRGLRRGVARVGVLPSASKTILPDAIKRLLNKHPGLVVNIVEGSGESLATALASRRIDLAVAAELPMSEDLAPLGSVRGTKASEVAIVTAANHPLATKTDANLDQALAFGWILAPTGSSPRTYLEQVLAGLNKPSPRVVVETRSGDIAKSLLVGTDYIAWLNRATFLAEEQAGLLRSLDLPELLWQRRFTIYKRRFGNLSPAAHALADELRSC